MLNQVFIMGNISTDLNLKRVSNELAVNEFSVAVNSKKKVDGEYKEKVSFFQVVTFGKTAENCAQYLSKGSKVLIHGELEQQRWEKDGKNHSTVKVIANIVTFLDPKPKSGQATGQERAKEVF